MDKTSNLWVSKKVVIASLITVAFLSLNLSICQAAENIVRTINIQYPSKQINDETTVVGVPGAQYTFQVEGDLPAGTHIEWKDQTTTKGSWSGNVLTPYETGGGAGSYSITAVLVGGEGEGEAWEATASGSITNPLLTFSLPSDDEYFAKDQTGDHTVNIKVTVTRSGGTELQGVTVKFIAEKQSSGQVNIGSAATNSSGEAGKDWNVPVGTPEIYTLKAGTGNSYENLENETTGEKVWVVEVKVSNIDHNPFCPYPDSNQTTSMILTVTPTEYNGYKEVRIMKGGNQVKKFVPGANLIQWHGKDDGGDYTDIGNHTIECAITSGGDNTNQNGLGSIGVEPDVVAVIPDPNYITADNTKESSCEAELHDETGVDASAVNSVTFTVETNPRGTLVSPVNAESGVATSTFTPNTMIWSEYSKPSGTVKTTLCRALTSNNDTTKRIAVVPQPGIDVEVLRSEVVGLTVTVWADSRQKGPTINTDVMNDDFKANSSCGWDTWAVEIDWDDGDTTNFIQSQGTGIGSKSHTYDESWEGKQVTITMSVGGIVDREYPYGTERHDYGDDTETIDAQL